MEEMQKDCMDDYRDIGGRTMPGAIVELSLPCTSLHRFLSVLLIGDFFNIDCSFEIRLQGCKRYNPMDGGGRIVPGATIENDSGDKVEQIY
jgi:hypothetical protein